MWGARSNSPVFYKDWNQKGETMVLLGRNRTVWNFEKFSATQILREIDFYQNQIGYGYFKIVTNDFT